MKLVKIVAALMLLSLHIQAEEAPKAEAPKGEVAVQAAPAHGAAPAHQTVAKGAKKKTAPKPAEPKK